MIANTQAQDTNRPITNSQLGKPMPSLMLVFSRRTSLLNRKRKKVLINMFNLAAHRWCYFGSTYPYTKNNSELDIVRLVVLSNPCQVSVEFVMPMVNSVTPITSDDALLCSVCFMGAESQQLSPHWGRQWAHGRGSRNDSTK